MILAGEGRVPVNLGVKTGLDRGSKVTCLLEDVDLMLPFREASLLLYDDSFFKLLFNPDLEALKLSFKDLLE